MSAYIHCGPETINLGNPFSLLHTFAEMGRAAGDEYDSFADLFGVPDATMEDADADPQWLADVRRQAKEFELQYGDELSADAKHVLADLTHTPAGATDAG